MINKKIILIAPILFLSGCSMISFENKDTYYKDNACLMLKENPDWLSSTVSSYNKWKVPISIQLAFVRQESSFRHDARPIRKNKWYEMGTNYASTAYGYSQALDNTWKDYQNKTRQPFKDRTSFNDSVHFIGWYNNISVNKLNLSRLDSYSLYLAYHEGWTGYKNKSYKNKKFLKEAAKKVDYWSMKYSKQLNNCKFKRSQ